MALTPEQAAARLSPQQIAYAAADAWICRELYLRFESLDLLRCARRGRRSARLPEAPAADE